jgi:hypothetical protein
MGPPRPPVLARAGKHRLAVDRHDLGVAAAGVDRLVSWADAHPNPHPTHRGSCLAWRCRGHQALRDAGSPGGLEVVGGVDETRPRLHSAPVRLTLLQPITAAELDLVSRSLGETVEVGLRSPTPPG